MIIQFNIDSAVPKARPRFMKSGRTYTPKRTSAAEQAIKNAYEGASIRKYGKVVTAPLRTEVTVAVTFQTPAPKQRPRWVPKVVWQLGEMPFTTKPDVDNLLKTVLDGLNGVAWEDDSQVTELHGYKLHRKRDGKTLTTVTVVWEEQDGQEDQ